MNLWLTAAVALLPALAAAGWLAAAGDLENRLVALELGTTLAVFMLILLSVGYDQTDNDAFGQETHIVNQQITFATDSGNDGSRVLDLDRMGLITRYDLHRQRVQITGSLGEIHANHEKHR